MAAAPASGLAEAGAAALAAALLLAAGPAMASAPPDFRFETFRAVCLDGFRDTEARARAVAGAGFEAVADDAHPMLATFMKVSRDAIEEAKAEDGFTGTAAAFRKTVEGRDLYVVTTTLDMPPEAEWKIDFLGCYLYDFAAEAPLDPAQFTTHFDEAPAETYDEAGLVGQKWNVEKLDGVWDVSTAYFTKDGPAATAAGFSGLVIKITSTRE